ncbi:hypothetical protein [Thalassomonas actiniarum]|uniref:Uncharacterized protein n=1 Tax=Thalassomonas actiniarum TaxID=485447 RepID=A0AAE9YKR3_9GAMM|nr:hypothetical protein [Thalassomonas actiniarum]WDD97340.1 hypothetical protein SG35_018665 [Thalassomonas actiniarum]
MKILTQILDWLFNRQGQKAPAKSGKVPRSSHREKKTQPPAQTTPGPKGDGKKKPLTNSQKNNQATTAKSNSESKKSNKQNPLRQTKSYQKTLTLLNHVHKEKLLKRVRVRANEHPQLTAAVIKGWLSKGQAKKRDHTRQSKTS